MLNFPRGDVHQMAPERVQIFLIQQLQDDKTDQAAGVRLRYLLKCVFSQLKCVAGVSKCCRHITGS